MHFDFFGFRISIAKSKIKEAKLRPPRTFYVIIISFALTIIAIFLQVIFPGVGEKVRAKAPYLDTIAILIAIYAVSYTLFSDFTTTIKWHLKSVIRVKDKSRTVLSVYDPVVGFEYLVDRLYRSTAVFNTRFVIPDQGYTIKYESGLKNWRNAIENYLKDPDVRFTEIIASDETYISDAEKLQNIMQGQAYQVKKLKNDESFFRNFTVFVLNDGTEEIWWGWGHCGNESLYCYATSDSQFIKDYKKRFLTLFNDSKVTDSVPYTIDGE